MPIVRINIDACKGCGLCVHVCPKQVLVIDSNAINKKGYNPARFAHPDKCTGCASCARMCPDVCIEVER